MPYNPDHRGAFLVHPRAPLSESQRELLANMAKPIRVPQAQARRRWRWVERISSQTPVLITRCGQPWAVVMGVEPYMAAKTAARLASLREPGGGERLRSVLTGPAHLDGQVLAGVAAPPRAERTLHP